MRVPARTFAVPVLVLCGALVACSGGKSTEPAAMPTTAGAPGAAAAGNDADGTITVTIEPVAVQRVDRTVDFVGTLHANAEAEVATEVDGRLLTVGADLGDPVAAGQVLASLDSATLDAQLREATANLEKSTTDLARARRLKDLQSPVEGLIVNLEPFRALDPRAATDADEVEERRRLGAAGRAAMEEMGDDAPRLLFGQLAFGEPPELLGCRMCLHRGLLSRLATRRES